MNTAASPPVLQIHPTRRCNLSCLHCYSSSSPSASDELPVEMLEGLIDEAAQMGFRYLSVSGGEPFLYKDLARMLERARGDGMQVAVATNGFFADAKRMRAFAGLIDTLGVSVDGLGDAHNQVRGSPKAFGKVEQAIDAAHAADIAPLLICGIRRSNWQSIPEIYEFACERGVRRLHFHPIEMSGRATLGLAGEALSEDDLLRVFTTVQVAAAEHSGIIATHLDLLHRSWVVDDPGLVHARRSDDELLHASMADAVRLLAVEPDGTLSPVSYGMAAPYQLGNLRHTPLHAAWHRFNAKGMPALRRLFQSLYQEIVTGRHADVFNWHELVVSKSASDVEHSAGEDIAPVWH